MLRFFSKIRYQLAAENRVAKYLRYAVGEILLVVIGILIALQVNNWNEIRMQRIEEYKMLRNIKSNIEKDLIDLSRNIKRFDEAARSIDVLMSCMKQDLPYNDSLSYHFVSTTQLWAPQIRTEYFESLSSVELNMISNDSLKMEILTYYSTAKGNFTVLINRYANIIEDASRNVFKTRFNAMWNGTWSGSNESADSKVWSMIPNDFEALKKDREYLYFLATIKNQMFWFVRNPLNNTTQEAELLLESIKLELKKEQ